MRRVFIITVAGLALAAPAQAHLPIPNIRKAAPVLESLMEMEPKLSMVKCTAEGRRHILCTGYYTHAGAMWDFRSTYHRLDERRMMVAFSADGGRQRWQKIFTVRPAK